MVYDKISKTKASTMKRCNVEWWWIHVVSSKCTHTHIHTHALIAELQKKTHKNIFVFYLNYIHLIKCLTLAHKCAFTLDGQLRKSLLCSHRSNWTESWLIFQWMRLIIFSVECTNMAILNVHTHFTMMPILQHRCRQWFVHSLIIHLIFISNFWKSNSSLAWHFYYTCLSMWNEIIPHCVCVCAAKKNPVCPCNDSFYTMYTYNPHINIRQIGFC